MTEIFKAAAAATVTAEGNPNPNPNNNKKNNKTKDPSNGKAKPQFNFTVISFSLNNLKNDNSFVYLMMIWSRHLSEQTDDNIPATLTFD